MNKILLDEINDGALQEKFTKSFEKVVENLQNPETSYRTTREITIKMKFTQNEKRDDVKCGISVTEKLAPQQSMETAFAIGKDLQSGEIYAEEYGKQIKGQMSLQDYENEEDEPIGNFSDISDNVVDLRKSV